MQGKHIVVTGATSGIGLETARALVEMGASLSFIAREGPKTTKTLFFLQKAAKGGKVDCFPADLSSQAQIRSAAKEILIEHPSVDVLVNNAGTWQSRFGLTEDGVERMFAVNHLAYFLLTHCLIEGLKEPASSRVINVSSDSHFKGKIHWGNLNLKGNYHGLRAYAQSKLANVLFSHEFVRRNPGFNIRMNAVQPGLVKTDIGTKHTNFLHSFAWRLRRLGGTSPEKGAATSVYLASNPDAEGISGKYWDNCAIKPSSVVSQNAKDAAKLWDISERLCGIENYFSSVS